MSAPCFRSQTPPPAARPPGSALGEALRRRAVVALAAAAAVTAVAVAGCGAPQEPSGRLEVATTEAVLPYPERIVLDLTWSPSAPIEEPTVFVHLLDPDGGVVRTFDHPYPGPWRPGEPASYPLELWQSALGPPLPAGVYDLTIGVYTPGGRRYALEAPGTEVDHGEYAVAKIEAPPAPIGGPRLAFGPAWEAGAMTDRQTLGAHWLGDGGALTVDGLDGALDLALVVRVPAPEEMPLTLVLDPGASGPAVEISSPCLGEPVRLEGPGFHEPTLRLRPDPGNRTCEIRFEPDFVYLDPATLRRVSVELRRALFTSGAAAP